MQIVYVEIQNMLQKEQRAPTVITTWTTATAVCICRHICYNSIVEEDVQFPWELGFKILVEWELNEQVPKVWKKCNSDYLRLKVYSK